MVKQVSFFCGYCGYEIIDWRERKRAEAGRQIELYLSIELFKWMHHYRLV